MERRVFVSGVVAGITGLVGCLDGVRGGDGTVDDPAPTSDQTPTPDPTTVRTTEPEETLVGPRNGDELPADPDPDNGYPPAFDRQPDERLIDTESFETRFVPGGKVSGSDEGREVPLAPIEATYYWYARGEARFVDARGEAHFDRTHVYGAVASPAPDGGDVDPVEEWPTDDRVVCYCGCPHALSSIRGANLLEAGFEDVYVIEEGVREWHDRGYPMAGANVENRPAEYVIEGVTDPSSSGDLARVVHEPTGESSAGVIERDGSYTVAFDFDGVGADTVLAVETPEYRVETSLLDAVDGGIRPPEA